MKTLVMKFGGASVATPHHFARIADIIIQRRIDYSRIVVVVSAMGDTTDQLIALAHAVNHNPPKREYDMLISVGERVSISLLAMALEAKGLEKAVSFTGSQSGIITCAQHSDARIVDVRPRRLLAALEAGAVAIVAGFQGVSLQGEITTLGRGGSDTSAVALAIALGAEKVEFFKDVNGLYPEDPKVNAHIHPFSEISYASALQIIEKGADVLQARSINLAQKNGVILHVRSFIDFVSNLHSGTLVGSSEVGTRGVAPIYEDNVNS